MAAVLPSAGLSSLVRPAKPRENNSQNVNAVQNFDGLHVQQPKLPSDASRGDRVSISSADAERATADKQLNDYLSFLAQLKNPDGDLGRFVAEAEKLFDALQSFDGVTSPTAENLAFDSAVLGDVQITSAESGEGAITAARAVTVRTETAVSGDIRLTDGTVVHFESSASFQLSAVDVFSRPPPATNASDPLAIDLDGDGVISLSGVSDGIQFDINADGRLDQTAFVRGNDGFLAFDRNSNGKIDNGGELFGDQHGAANGYAELAKFDQDGNGQIDARDEIYQLLSVIRRGNAGQLYQQSLESLGVKSIQLGHQNVDQAAEAGNRISQISTAQTDGGNKITADVVLQYSTASAPTTSAK